MIRLEEPPRSGSFKAYSTALEWALNQASGRGGGTGEREPYLRLIHQVSTHLRPFMPPAALDNMFFSPHYLALLRNQSTADAMRLTNYEYDRLVPDLEDLRGRIAQQAQVWSQPLGCLLIPDTNYYLKEHRPLDALPYGQTFDQRGNLTLVILSSVVDELDRIKDTGGAGTEKAKNLNRRRARAVLKFIEGNAGSPGSTRAIQFPSPENGMGAVNLAVVLDEVGHDRLPIVDDEIVSRAVALRSATGLQVRLASYDKTGFTLRARSENFDCEAPTIPPPPNDQDVIEGR